VPARFDIIASIQLLVMVVVGGVYSPSGAVLGAVLLTVLPEFGREWERYRLMGYGILIVLLMVFAPGGLMSLAHDVFGRLARLRGTVMSAIRVRLPNLP
jgi:branched-chain amino acid transport system permease protein